MPRMKEVLAPTDRFWKRQVTEAALRNAGTHKLKSRAWRGCDAKDDEGTGSHRRDRQILEETGHRSRRAEGATLFEIANFPDN